MNARPDMRARLGDIPHQPGVYLMLDRLGSVIYVGKARDLRKRLGNHFMPSRKQRADHKTRALLDAIWDFEIHLVRNEQEALLLEGKLINSEVRVERSEGVTDRSERNDAGGELGSIRNGCRHSGSDAQTIEHRRRLTVSYTHLTLPTNREV